jgi:hypothetical protein
VQDGKRFKNQERKAACKTIKYQEQVKKERQLETNTLDGSYSRRRLAVKEPGNNLTMKLLLRALPVQTLELELVT